jgi:hypothetical protein
VLGGGFIGSELAASLASNSGLYDEDADLRREFLAEMR